VNHVKVTFSQPHAAVCVCLLLQDLVINCLRGVGDVGGHVLRETTSRGLCGLVCPSHAAFSKRAIMEAGDGGKDLDFGWCVFYYCRTYYIAVRVGVD